MQTLEELRSREPVTAYEMYRIEGSLQTHVLVDGAINSLAAQEINENLHIWDRLGRLLGLFKSRSTSQAWERWGAGRELKCAALELAGWVYDESNQPFARTAQAYERVRQILISPECRSGEDLLRMLGHRQ